MRLDFDANEDSAAQAVLLINALNQWLSEQPEPLQRSGKAEFIYRPDGSLDSIRTVLDEV